jgi:hypothetical protein
MGQSWGRVFEIKENFHKGFELVAPLANKILLHKKNDQKVPVLLGSFMHTLGMY